MINSTSFDCPVCYGIGDGDGSPETGLAMVDNCGHVFHIKCINEWRDRGNQTCPTCRQSCQKVCTLYGSIVPITLDSDDPSETESNGNGADKDAVGVQLLYATLMDDYAKLKEDYTKLEHFYKHICKRSDRKDLENWRFQRDLRESNKRIEALELELAIFRSKNEEPIVV